MYEVHTSCYGYDSTIRTPYFVLRTGYASFEQTCLHGPACRRFAGQCQTRNARVVARATPFPVRRATVLFCPTSIRTMRPDASARTKGGALGTRIRGGAPASSDCKPEHSAHPRKTDQDESMTVFSTTPLKQATISHLISSRLASSFRRRRPDIQTPPVPFAVVLRTLTRRPPFPLSTTPVRHLHHRPVVGRVSPVPARHPAQSIRIRTLYPCRVQSRESASVNPPP